MKKSTLRQLIRTLIREEYEPVIPKAFNKTAAIYQDLLLQKSNKIEAIKGVLVKKNIDPAERQKLIAKHNKEMKAINKKITDMEGKFLRGIDKLEVGLDDDED